MSAMSRFNKKQEEIYPQIACLVFFILDDDRSVLKFFFFFVFLGEVDLASGGREWETWT